MNSHFELESLMKLIEAWIILVFFVIQIRWYDSFDSEQKNW